VVQTVPRSFTASVAVVAATEDHGAVVQEDSLGRLRRDLAAAEREQAVLRAPIRRRRPGIGTMGSPRLSTWQRCHDDLRSLRWAFWEAHRTTNPDAAVYEHGISDPLPMPRPLNSRQRREKRRREIAEAAARYAAPGNRHATGTL
jgi:hypothetical protein